MTKEELEKATGQELIDERNYCGVDGYYGDYLDDVNAEMLKRFNRLAELEKRCANYEMTISKMEKGTCDICKETEKDKKIEELEKACKETQELLDRQIEATYRLDKENAELKKDKKELCHSISEGGKACVYLNEQLTKTKEIFKKLYAVYYDPCVTESDLKYRDELFAEIKQFLSEVEK